MLERVRRGLRTVPTNKEVFLCGLCLCGENRSQQELLKSKKKIGSNHAFFLEIIVTFFGKTDTNAFPFKRRNRLPSVYIRLNGSFKRLNGLLIRLKKNPSV